MATKPKSYFEKEQARVQEALLASQDESERRRLTSYLVWVRMHLRFKASHTRQASAGFPEQLAGT